MTITRPAEGAKTQVAFPLRVNRRRFFAIALAIAALLAPFVLPPVDVLKLASVLVWTTAAVGLNLVTGYARLVALSQGTMVAVGAYSSAILMSELSWSFWATVLVAVSLSFGLGLAIGVPALRLRGMYLALLTLAIAIAAPPLIKQAEGLTGGTMGLPVAQLTPPGWLPVADDQFVYFVCLIVAVAASLLAWNLVRSLPGLAVRLVGGLEPVAAPLGVNVSRTKVLVFAWGSAMGGAAGALYACLVGFVHPDSFSVMLGATLMLALVVGGARTTLGPLIGGLFIVYVPELAGGVDQQFAGVIYGVAVIVVLVVAPGGVVGSLSRFTRGLKRRGRARDQHVLESPTAAA